MTIINVEQGTFAGRLRRLRARAGLSQQELADRAGVSARSVSDLERGVTQRPRRDSAVMLAKGLGLSGEERIAFLEATRRPRQTALASAIPSPVPRTNPIIGREAELQAINTALLVDASPLLTLTGPGGIGKTRLALEVVQRLACHFADDIHFIRLDGVHDSSLVLSALASALHVQESAALPLTERLVARLAHRKQFLIFDNFEHVIGAAPVLAELLQRAPHTQVLVTSREALRVQGERVIVVPPLPQPDSPMRQTAEPLWDSDLRRSPAVALFMERALAVSVNLSFDVETAEGRANLAIVTGICRLLDGLPLAIELAAAQTEVFSPGAILALLTSSGLPLLAGGRRDQPSRLQTMSAAIAWSFDLLSAEEQAVFRALSVCAGSFSLPAAAAVAGLTTLSPADEFDPRQPLMNLDPVLIDTIGSLARKNLLAQDSTAPDFAGPRFRLLEPIRLFALEQLRAAGEESTARRRHSAFFTQLAELLDPLTVGPETVKWLSQQALELDNFRTALDWAWSAEEHNLFVRLTANVAQFWKLRGYLEEARQWIGRALTVDAGSSPTNRWFLRYWAVTFAMEVGDYDGAYALATELLEIAQAHDERDGIGVGYAALSRAVGALPDRHDEAANLAHRAVEVLEPLGRDEWTGLAWLRLGVESHHLGQLDEARDALLQALAYRRREPFAGLVAYTLVSLGAVWFDLGKARAAVDAYHESLELALAEENRTLLVAVLLGLADVAWRYGEDGARTETALVLAGAADGMRVKHGLGRETLPRAVARWQKPMRAALGDTAVDALFATGNTLSLDEIKTIAAGIRLTKDSSPKTAHDPPMTLLTAFGSLQ